MLAVAPLVQAISTWPEPTASAVALAPTGSVEPKLNCVVAMLQLFATLAATVRLAVVVPAASAAEARPVNTTPAAAIRVKVRKTPLFIACPSGVETILVVG